MKTRQVIILAAAGVVLAGLAWLTSREGTGEGSARTGGKLLPGLDINAVDEIVIAAAGETTRVARAESGWQLPERYYYPANFETIRQLLIKLERLKIGQTVAAGERQRGQLELTTPAATTLTLKAGGYTVAELALGAPRQPQGDDTGIPGFGGMPDGRYVAVGADPSVYLIGDMLFEAATDSRRWLDTLLLDVSSAAVTAVTIENAEDGEFTLRKNADGEWDFDPARKDVPFDKSKAFTLTGALGYLTMQDVADPVLTDEELGFAGEPRLFRVQTDDGIRYDIHIGETADGQSERYIRIAVEFTGAPSRIVETTEKGEDAELKAAANAIMAAEEVKNKAVALHARLSPWTFSIPVYKAGVLASSRESLIKKPEPPADGDNDSKGNENEQ